MFLKNREVRISLANTNEKKTEDFDEMVATEIGKSAVNVITGMAKELLKPAAIIVVGSIVTVKVVDVICDIAFEKTTRKDQ